MKSLFQRFFKKESPYNYTIAHYPPVRTDRLPTDAAFTEYQLGVSAEKDEMDIDKIYQST